MYSAGSSGSVHDLVARVSYNQSHKTKAGVAFLAALLLWMVSVLFEIVFNKHKELPWIVYGTSFFQLAKWVVRFSVSGDPLSVNTAASLLHSTVTSASGSSLTSAFHFIIFCCFYSCSVVASSAIFVFFWQWNSFCWYCIPYIFMRGKLDGWLGFVMRGWLLNWTMFVLARFVSHFLVTVKLIRDGSQFEKGIELPIALLGMVGMNLLNFFQGV